MNGLNLVLGFMMLMIVSSCGNAPSPTQQDVVDAPAPSMSTPTIDEKAEIEVIDLTDEVALYVVLAGAYSTTESAMKKVAVLKQAGFANADVIQRPGSKLYSALVERFDSEESAKQFAEQIASNKEIKSFVYQMDE